MLQAMVISEKSSQSIAPWGYIVSKGLVMWCQIPELMHRQYCKAQQGRQHPNKYKTCKFSGNVIIVVDLSHQEPDYCKSGKKGLKYRTLILIRCVQNAHIRLHVRPCILYVYLHQKRIIPLPCVDADGSCSQA